VEKMAAQGVLFDENWQLQKISRIPTWHPQLQKNNTIVHPENVVNFKIIWKIFSLIFLMAHI